MNSNNAKIFFLNFITIFSFIIDRLAKKIFFANREEYFIFGDFLRLKLAFNSGIAFGIRLDAAVIWFFYVVIFVILVWFLTAAISQRQYFVVFCLGFVIAGAFSNLLDRLYVGQVIDYIDVKHFSVFNLADAMIVGGVMGVLGKNIAINHERK